MRQSSPASTVAIQSKEILTHTVTVVKCPTRLASKANTKLTLSLQRRKTQLKYKLQIGPKRLRVLRRKRLSKSLVSIYSIRWNLWDDKGFTFNDSIPGRPWTRSNWHPKRPKRTSTLTSVRSWETCLLFRSEEEISMRLRTSIPSISRTIDISSTLTSLVSSLLIAGKSCITMQGYRNFKRSPKRSWKKTKKKLRNLC